MEMIYEIAHTNARNRGHFIVPSKLDTIIKGKMSNGLVYKSVYAYDKSILEHFKTRKSVAKFNGTRYIEDIVFDIDKKENTDQYTKDKCIELVIFLEDKLGLEEHEYQIYFSGTGYHIHTSNKLWGFDPSPDLPYQVKETIKKVLKPLGKHFFDESIYMATGMFRLRNTINQKSGLYKVPLTRDELMMESPDAIKLLASVQRFPDDEFYYSDEILETRLERLKNHIIKKEAIPVQDKAFSKEIQRSNVACCINKILQQGATEGSRNQSILRIATHLRRNNIPEEFAIAGMKYWNNLNGQGIEESLLTTKIKQTYRSPYNYGCNDALLKEHCSHECIFFKTRNYNLSLMNTEDLVASMEKYRDTDLTGRTIDLALMLGEDNKDVIIEPGDLVTIIGGTGVNKTTFIQHLMLAMDFKEGTIHLSQQLPTLFIELELPDYKLMRRFTQLICGVSKQEALKNFDKYKKEVIDAMSNIIISRDIRNTTTLRQKIMETGSKLVVIDYLQCFKDFTSNINDIQYIAKLSHELRDIATELQIIIIVLSQVTKEAKKEKHVHMDSGKGAGDISDSSTCIITINGQPDNIYRNIKVEKMTDGDSIYDGIMLEFNKNDFKLERIG